MKINQQLTISNFTTDLEKLWHWSGIKIEAIQNSYDESKGSPVFTVNGKYTTRGWTEWTQGFQYGSAVLQYEATGEQKILDIARTGVMDRMTPHLTHMGVHDHGFNNVSTYGNFLRLIEEGTLQASAYELEYYKLALKVSGAVQAARWSPIHGGGGYLYSFNGPQSLFVDTIRSVRALMISHFLGHTLKGENDVHTSLFERGIEHILATAKFNVYYGEGRDTFDLRGRTAHECLFNTNDGRFRAPSTQQGFSGFTTWTRGLAWAICGFAEELEFLNKVDENYFPDNYKKEDVIETITKAFQATADFYIEYTSTDGIPLWDTGGPNTLLLGNYKERNSEPYNDLEPIDSSAAAIAAQGLLRGGIALSNSTYIQAGLTTAKTLFSDEFLSTNEDHQGLLLHSVYHYPNGWDNVPAGRKVPCGESSMWGDYHLRELGILMQRLLDKKSYYAFYNCLPEFRNK